MKNYLLGVLLVFGSAASAQVYTPPTPETDSIPPADQPPSVAPVPLKNSNPFGAEIPLLDPSAETVTVAGITIPLGDNRILQARFEKYLAQPEENSAAAAEYRANIDKILAELSPYREGGPDLKAAFKLLPAAAAYPGDSRICFTLAEAVYTAMLAKRDTQNLRKINAALEEEKQQRIKDGDWKARTDRNQKTGNSRSADQGEGAANNVENSQATTTGRGTTSLEFAEILRRIAEVEAEKKKNLVQVEVQVLESKIQYQANMALWTLQRRYQHVLMASRFYNQIWRDGDAALHLDEGSAVSKMFTESLGVSPTVATLDSLANEAIQETIKAIEAFKFLVQREELHTASKRLLEAFLIGEYLAPVATLEREMKRKVQEYVRNLHELYAAMQARDYVRAKELVGTLRELAKDFPSAKADSAIAGYTLASDLSVEKAKAYLIADDQEKATVEIAAAAELWPTNPKLDEFKDLIAKSGAVVTARNDFDRLLSEQNYREIFRRRFEFVPVIQGDPQREDAMQQILENIKKIEIALNKASEFANIGNSYAAWEQLATLREQFPDDPNLGRELEKLTPKVSPFVNALERARQFEDRTPQQTGSAMSWYLRAKRMFPDSKLAEEGFQRLLDRVLPEGDTLPPNRQGSSSPAEATGPATPTAL